MPFRAVVLNLGPPDVLGLHLPEILASRGGGEGFWELYSKNIWRPKLGDHWTRSLLDWQEEVADGLGGENDMKTAPK